MSIRTSPSPSRFDASHYSIYIIMINVSFLLSIFASENDNNMMNILFQKREKCNIKIIQFTHQHVLLLQFVNKYRCSKYLYSTNYHLRYDRSIHTTLPNFT